LSNPRIGALQQSIERRGEHERTGIRHRQVGVEAGSIAGRRANIGGVAMSLFNWDDLKFFIELVRTRSPSDAARRLKADHTTVRRRVAALEDTLRTRLFASRGVDYNLTAEGERLFEYAEAMENLANRALEDISNSDVEVAGNIRIGVPEGLGAYFLGTHLAKFARQHPKLRVNMVVLPKIMNLSNREADLAIAYSPPDQLRQIVRRLTDYKLYIYGSREYLEKSAPIGELEDLKQHMFLGYVPDLMYAPQLDYLAELPVEVDSRFEATSIVTQTRAVLAGAGLCILPSFIAAQERELRPVLPDKFSLDRQFWLVIHPSALNLARVRSVIDFLTETIRVEKKIFMVPQPYETSEVPLP
jgi:DNA-binding transcriptional LysR family regulator